MRRQPLYIGDGANAAFGWLHTDEAAPARDCVAVLCAPVGHEYTRAHRTIRHLADRLAHRGIAALRFDYHGIGDSPGSDLDPDRVGRWLADIRAAVAKARELSGRPRVCLIGVRLGGTLAAMATWDKAKDLESARKLHGLDPALLVVGHGPAVRSPAAAMSAAIARASS